MQTEYYYNSVIKNIITAFGILFSDIKTVTDEGEEIVVPLHYAPQEKWVSMIQTTADFEDGYEVSYTLPRMGFAMTGMMYDSQRMLNPLSKIRDRQNNENFYMYNRIPYNFDFSLYIAGKKFEDTLKIVEQIIPFFSPDLSLPIKEREEYNLVTDVPVNLNNVDFDITYDDGFEHQRYIQWTLSFTAKGFLYSNTRNQTRIKKAILKLGQKEMNTIYESLIAEVVPDTAKENGTYEIIESLIAGDTANELYLTIQDAASVTGSLSENGDLEISFESADESYVAN